MKRSVVLALTIAIATSTACAGRGHERVALTYVNREPPAERAEVISTAPGRDYAWVKGHWAWRHDDYEWMPGHWQRIEDGRRDWIAGHWSHDRQGWYWVEGYWRT